MGRRCAACTRRCSSHQARISGVDVVEWVAAALPMTAPLRRSECLPTAVAGSPSSADKADKKTKCLLPAQLLLWGEQHRQQLAAGSCPIVAASCLMSSLIKIALAASSAASAIRRQGLVCLRSLEAGSCQGLSH